MCEIEPWGLTDPEIYLCKALYEDVIINMYFCSDPEQINPLNQKLMEYETCDSRSTIEINNSIGTWISHSEYFKPLH